MRTRKIPLRKCVACQEMKGKRELVRIVKTPEDEIVVDVTGKRSGRGAYLCGNRECLHLARKSNALDRALKCKLPADIYEVLEQQFIFKESGD